MTFRNRAPRRLALPGLVLSACLFGRGPPDYDLVIQGGTVFDGTGTPGVVTDLAIKGERIAAIGDVGGSAERTIDATGLYVAPAFVDMHSHSELRRLLDGGQGPSFAFQGLTTEVYGETTSMGPRGGRIEDALPEQLEGKWETLGGFLDYLDETGIAINVASYVGSGSVIDRSALRQLGVDSGPRYRAFLAVEAANWIPGVTRVPNPRTGRSEWTGNRAAYLVFTAQDRRELTLGPADPGNRTRAQVDAPFENLPGCVVIGRAEVDPRTGARGWRILPEAAAEAIRDDGPDVGKAVTTLRDALYPAPPDAADPFEAAIPRAAAAPDDDAATRIFREADRLPLPPLRGWRNAPIPDPVLWRDPDPDAVLSAGEVAILAAEGATGKSTLTLALSGASAIYGGGDHGQACALRLHPGPAVVVGFEDSPAERASRRDPGPRGAGDALRRALRRPGGLRSGRDPRGGHLRGPVPLLRRHALRAGERDPGGGRGRVHRGAPRPGAARPGGSWGSRRSSPQRRAAVVVARPWRPRCRSEGRYRENRPAVPAVRALPQPEVGGPGCGVQSPSTDRPVRSPRFPHVPVVAARFRPPRVRTPNCVERRLGHSGLRGAGG